LDIDAFVSELRLRGCSVHTLKAYRSDLSSFASFLRERRLRINQVTPTVAGQYIEQLGALSNPRSHAPGLRQATIERRVAALSSFFDWMGRRNPRLRNPFSILKNSRARIHRIVDPQGLAVDEASLKRLMHGVSNSRDKALIALFVASGLRLSELANLNVESISHISETLPDGSVRVYGTGTTLGKGKKERRFYFDSEAVDLIAEYLETRVDECPALFISQRGARLSQRAIQVTLATWCARLGLRHMHIHQLRHTFATRLANADIDAMVLRDLMGHSEFSTTTRYFRLAEETKARQYFSAMEFLAGPAQSEKPAEA
jgi:site-specific recombinase XerC